MNESTIVITGANTGIGKTTALALAQPGRSFVLAGRSEQRTQPVVDALRERGCEARFVAVDLARLEDVRRAASALAETTGPIDVLINNAGVAGARGATEEGFELAFGINHLGHFLWTHLLLERVRAAARGRVVTVASRAHYDARPWNWDTLQHPTASATGLPEYAASKLANVLFSAELARRLGPESTTTTYALHPGVVATEIWRNIPAGLDRLIKWFMISPERGAETTVHCAQSEQAGRETGLYYTKSRPKQPSDQARDARLAAELWERSAAWCGVPAG